MAKIVIKEEWVQLADMLGSDQERGLFYSAVCHYSQSGILPQFKGQLRLIFEIVQRSIDVSNVRRRVAKIRWSGDLHNAKHNAKHDTKHNALHDTKHDTNLQKIGVFGELLADSVPRNGGKLAISANPAPIPPPEIDLINRSENSAMAQEQPSRIERDKENKEKGYVVPPKEKEKQREKEDDFSALIPAILRTPEFIAIWGEWEQARRSNRKKLSKLAATRQLRMLATYPVAEAIEMLDASIRNDWQGVFSLKNQPKPKSKQRDYTGI